MHSPSDHATSALEIYYNTLFPDQKSPAEVRAMIRKKVLGDPPAEVYYIFHLHSFYPPFPLRAATPGWFYLL